MTIRVCGNEGPVIAAIHSPGDHIFCHGWMVLGGGGEEGAECSATDSPGRPILGGTS